MSPFYLSSAHVSQVSSVSSTGELLERTIRSAVEQHLFDVNSSGGQSSEDSESGASSSSSTSTKQRRRQAKEQDESRHSRDVGRLNKENIPSGFSNLDECMLNACEVEKLYENTSGYIEKGVKPKRQKSSSRLSELNENQDGLVNMENLNPTPSHERTGSDHVELISDGSKENEKDGRQSQHLENPTMKIQEHPSLPDSKLQRTPDADDQQESFVSEVPELDLTALCDQKSWEEPIPCLLLVATGECGR